MAQVSLENSSFSFLTQGAIIQSFCLSGRNLVLSYSSAEPYKQAQYFSETIGRVANRISNGLIEDLNGRSYQLSTNLDEHHLHGGTIGWGHKEFSGPTHTSRNGKDTLLFTYTSPDGEEGYPGTLELRVWYTPHEDNKAAVLDIEYEAELIGKECEATVINITNHSYFNLSGDATVAGTEVELATNEHLVVTEDGLPTEDIAEYPGLKANRPFTLSETEPAIDNCFVMDKDSNTVPLDTRASELRKLVSAYHGSSGVHLEVYSTEPSFQFYTGDYTDAPATDDAPPRGARSGFCVEPGRFINAINVPKWRNQVVLGQGKRWGSRVRYRAWKA